MDKLKKSQTISPTFCMYPFVGTFVSPFSPLTPCVVGEGVKDEKGRYYNLKEISLEDYWNSYGMREIRKKMVSGEKPEVCKRCYLEESSGTHSHRMLYNTRFRDYFNRIEQDLDTYKTNGYRCEYPVQSLELRISNLCNLKCRMCWPGSSSKIEEEHKELLKKNPDYRHFVNVGFLETSKNTSWHETNEAWETIYKCASKVRELCLTGGEPLLMKQNWELLDYLKAKNYSKNIGLYISTNCTLPPEKLIEIFDAFSSFHIMFSIDGYQEVQEYIRYPSKWKVIEKNITRILKNKREHTYFFFNIVIQIYNILNLTVLLKWIDKLQENYGMICFNLLPVQDRSFLDISILPENVKKEALLRIQEYINSSCKTISDDLYQLGSIKNMLMQKENVGTGKDLKKFYKYTKMLDQHRNNNFEKTFPKLSSLLNEDGRWLE